MQVMTVGSSGEPEIMVLGFLYTESGACLQT